MLENYVCLKSLNHLNLDRVEKINVYLRCNGDFKRQIESLKLSNVILVGLLQAHPKTGADHLGEGTHGLDVG